MFECRNHGEKISPFVSSVLLRKKEREPSNILIHTIERGIYITPFVNQIFFSALEMKSGYCNNKVEIDVFISPMFNHINAPPGTWVSKNHNLLTNTPK